MRTSCIALVVVLVIFIAGCSSVSASPTARIASGFVTKVVSTLFKRLWSLKPTNKNAVPSRSLIKFESGYTVETVLEAGKLGIEPHSVEISTAGEIFILDSENSNIYKISSPLTRYSRPKLIAGSADGQTGHIDGRLKQARMNHPKGLAVDDSGNIYIADTMNMAIRKISENGVVTIAGRKAGRGGGHIDGPSEEARFSDDFDLVYSGSSCSLLVIDRGHQAIREILLHEDECSQQDDQSLHLGIAVLSAACFLGYMLALLQRRLANLLSYHHSKEPKVNAKGMRRPPKSAYPPLIPTENEHESQEEGLFTSLVRLSSNMGSSMVDILGGLFSSGSNKKPVFSNMQCHHHYPSGPRPIQESFIITREDGPPPVDTVDPTPRNSYPIAVSKGMEKTSYYNRAYYNGWERDYGPQPQLQHHQHHHKHQPARLKSTYYDPQNVEANEIVFGAVQEEEGPREAMVVKAVDYTNNNENSIRSRYNYMSYSSFGNY